MVNLPPKCENVMKYVYDATVVDGIIYFKGIYFKRRKDTTYSNMLVLRNFRHRAPVWKTVAGEMKCTTRRTTSLGIHGTQFCSGHGIQKLSKIHPTSTKNGTKINENTSFEFSVPTRALGYGQSSGRKQETGKS